MTLQLIEKNDKASGFVVKAFGNLLHVQFDGSIRQGEVAMVHVNDIQLKAEVIEIIGNEAKLQVFEDTKDISFNAKVEFQGDLLEAELGPGLLGSIIDGLQNPLELAAVTGGYFLPKGLYIPSIDRTRQWNYETKACLGQIVERGDVLGITQEGRLPHPIMVPFSLFGRYEITWVIESGLYSAETIVAKAKDELGQEYDFTMIQKWPIKNSLIQGEKVKPEKMMDTGCRIIDTQFPVMKGGTFCTPGPFGAGKTVLQHHLSKYSSVDIVVLVACGERAGEVVEVLREFPSLIDPRTGESLMSRTIIICNTSSMPVAARESSIYLGATIGEYYRQMGLDVLVLADSTSRWAQAMREISGRLEEIPGEEAFPVYLASRIASFYERSGVILLKNDIQGSMTIGGTVSPAGGNFEEPVTQATLAVTGTFLGLSRERSDSRRYPAIDPLISWSKYVNDVSRALENHVDGWSDRVEKADFFLRHGNEIEKRMEVLGQEGIAIGDLVIHLKAELYDFCYLQQNSFDKEDAYCPLKRQIHLFKLMNKIFDTRFSFQSHEKAHQFFLNLQNHIKNMNFMVFDSEQFGNAFNLIESLIDHESEVNP